MTVSFNFVLIIEDQSKFLLTQMYWFLDTETLIF
jgi:hypothetical protein